MIAVAFSGGVDSTLLLHLARQAIEPRKITAITLVSAFYPPWELAYAQRTTDELGIKHVLLETNPLDDPEISSNPPERCYTCKKTGFTNIRDYAESHNIPYICDGSCLDDLNDYRPGYQAVQELKISSPFITHKFRKNDIFKLSKELNIPGWNRPSGACLASRIPYNQPITLSALQLIAKAEEYLHTLNIPEARVRLHADIARIEVSETNIAKIISRKDDISHFIRTLGVTYVALELQNYKSGSMNQVLTATEKNNARQF